MPLRYAFLHSKKLHELTASMNRNFRLYSGIKGPPSHHGEAKHASTSLSPNSQDFSCLAVRTHKRWLPECTFLLGRLKASGSSLLEMFAFTHLFVLCLGFLAFTHSRGSPLTFLPFPADVQRSLPVNFTIAALNITLPNANSTGAPLVLGQDGRQFTSLHSSLAKIDICNRGHWGCPVGGSFCEFYSYGQRQPAINDRSIDMEILPI